MLRLTFFLVFLVLVTGCEAEINTPLSDDERMAALLDNLSGDLVGPVSDRTPLDCPDLEGVTPGRYTCTSTVDGGDVTWDVTVTSLTAADGGDSTAVGLTPDFGSTHANVERNLLRSFRTDLGVTMTSAVCPPSEADPYVGTCQVTYDRTAFDVAYQGRADGTFSYTPARMGIRAKIEQTIADGVEAQTGDAHDVSCEVADAWPLVIGETIVCRAESRRNDDWATFEATTTNLEGNHNVRLLSTSS